MLDITKGLAAVNAMGRNIVSEAKFQALLSCEKLLNTGKRKRYINDSRTLMRAPDPFFNSHCVVAMENLAEFIQDLPETKKGPYSHLGGMLDLRLERAAKALSVFHEQFETEPQSEEEAKIIPLWAYTIFSGTLLAEIGRLAIEYKVKLFDNKKAEIGLWSPLMGSMQKQQAAFYTVEFTNLSNKEAIAMATLSMAMSLMPAEGAQWILSDVNTRIYWMALLRGESLDTMAGGFGVKVVMPDAISRILGHNHELTANLKAEKTPTSFFLGKSKESNAKQNLNGQNTNPQNNAKAVGEHLFHDSNFNATGQNFLGWLRQQLQSGGLEVNQSTSWVHGYEHNGKQALLLSSELFQQYAKEHGIKHWQQVAASVNNAGVTSHRGLVGMQYQVDPNGPSREGLLVTQLGRIVGPNTPSIPAQNIKITSVILMKIPFYQRIANYQWPGVQNHITPALTPNPTTRGGKSS